MQKIISKSNEKIKQLNKLKQKKYRVNSYLVEGFHLLEEAIKADALIKQIFMTETAYQKINFPMPLVDIFLVSEEIMQYLSDSRTPQGVVAEIIKESDKSFTNFGKWLVLEKVQDPGNVGTMVRTADALGIDGVIISNDSADIYSPKVLRAMQGSHFHLPIIEKDILAFFENNLDSMPIYASTLSDDSIDLRELPHSDNWFLVMGNEGSGVSSTIQNLATKRVHIPMNGSAESFNVAVACGILLFTLSNS